MTHIFRYSNLFLENWTVTFAFTKNGQKLPIFHGFTFTRTDETTHVPSIIVAHESADKIWQLYLSNSNRGGKNSEATPTRSARVQRTAPAASKTDIVRHFVDAGYARSGIYSNIR